MYAFVVDDESCAFVHDPAPTFSCSTYEVAPVELVQLTVWLPALLDGAVMVGTAGGTITVTAADRAPHWLAPAHARTRYM